MAMHSLTCPPLASFDVHHCSPVFLSKVLQYDHVVRLIGVINEDGVRSHAQHLQIKKMKESNQRNSNRQLEFNKSQFRY